MNKELFGYNYLRKGSEEGKRKINEFWIFMMLGIIIGEFIAFPQIGLMIVMGMFFLGSIGLAFFQREQIKFIDYINSQGKIKRIYEKDWEKEK